MKAKSGNSSKEHTIADLRQAVSAAQAAQILWRDRSFKERKKIIGRISRIVLNHADEIAETIADCTGKTRFDAMSTEVFPAATAASYYSKTAEKFLKKRNISSGNILLSYKRSYLLHEPWGVIGIISPWNYPFGIPFHEVVMGLMSGNAVILKVATIARNAGELIKKITEEAGVPKNLFHLIHIAGHKAGPAFIEAGVNKLFFTGSIPVGKELMKLASGRLIPVCLELGGNDAMIVLEDASIDRAVNGALWAGLSNCGQSCGGVERIYVHKNIAKAFSDLLAERFKLLRIGREKEFDTDIGTLTTRDQYETVKSQVKEALSKGARVVASVGADDPKQLLCPALLIDNVSPEMKLMKDETFGPILALDTFSTDSEAIEKANATVYGLTASVWSKNISNAKKMAAKLEAGAVTINDHLMSHGLAETHWGGYKQSGIGRSHGGPGFEEMTQTKVVVNDLLHRLPRNMWWYPHSKKSYDGVKGVIEFLYADSFGKRISGLFRLISLFMGSFRKW